MFKSLEEKIEKMPKVELHLHLDGSIPIEYVKDKYSLSDSQIYEKMVASKTCKDLNDYLKCFEYPLTIMQNRKDIEDITMALLKKLKEQNVVYVEIRFAPQFHTKGGLTQEDVVKCVIEAKRKVDIKSNIILCIMRGKDNEKENFETVDIAKKYLSKGVCAVDLAGAEALYKTKEYKKIFEYVSKNNIPFTIHAGEADGKDSIISAIEFGAKRIGHGVRVVEDEETLNSIKKNEIFLEVCPTSNIQTCICDSYATHPISKLFDEGVKISVNTDNMTVSNTTLKDEYMAILKNTNIKYDNILKMNKDAINAAFITDNEKREILDKFRLWEELN